MKTVDFLARLHSLDIEVIVDGEQLRVNAPQDTLTPELRAELGERKVEVLTFLRQSHLKEDATHWPMSPVSRAENIPLSFAQERLWFLDQLEPGNSTYNMASAYYLKGPLNVVALERSFNAIVERHESLRTTFFAINGQPTQRIAPNLTLSLPVYDLCTLTENEREDRVQKFVAEEKAWVFKLDQGPRCCEQLCYNWVLKSMFYS